MARDEFKNLGFGEEKPMPEKSDDSLEKGEKNVLRW